MTPIHLPFDAAQGILLSALLCALALANWVSRASAKPRPVLRHRLRPIAANITAVWALAALLLEAARAVVLSTSGFAREALDSAGWSVHLAAVAAAASFAPKLLARAAAIAALARAAAADRACPTRSDRWVAAAIAVLGAAALEVVRHRAGERIRLAASADCRQYEEAWERRAGTEPAAALRLRRAVRYLEEAVSAAGRSQRARQWDSRAGAAVAVMDRLYAQVSPKPAKYLG